MSSAAEALRKTNEGLNAQLGAIQEHVRDLEEQKKKLQKEKAVMLLKIPLRKPEQAAEEFEEIEVFEQVGRRSSRRPSTFEYFDTIVQLIEQVLKDYETPE